jgi:hypothetical protein
MDIDVAQIHAADRLARRAQHLEHSGAGEQRRLDRRIERHRPARLRTLIPEIHDALGMSGFPARSLLPIAPTLRSSSFNRSRSRRSDKVGPWLWVAVAFQLWKAVQHLLAPVKEGRALINTCTTNISNDTQYVYL